MTAVSGGWSPRCHLTVFNHTNQFLEQKTRGAPSLPGSRKPSHPPGAPQPTKTQTQTAHHVCEAHATRPPLPMPTSPPLQSPWPLAIPQTSQTWSCLRALARAIPSTWNTLLSILSTAGSFSVTGLSSDATSSERPPLTTPSQKMPPSLSPTYPHFISSLVHPLSNCVDLSESLNLSGP